MVALSALPMNIAQRQKEASTFLPTVAIRFFVELTITQALQTFSPLMLSLSSPLRLNPSQDTWPFTNKSA